MNPITPFYYSKSTLFTLLKVRVQLPDYFKILSFVLAMTFFCSSVHAQQSSYGKRHWLAFMENLDLAFNGPPIFEVIVYSEYNTSCQLSLPATGLILDFVVKANVPYKYQLPAGIWYAKGSETIENKGILIESITPVSVYAFHYRPYFTESSLVLPESELGYSYSILSFLDQQGRSPSSFVVLSTEDNNQIEITPSVITDQLHPANKPFSITLNKGQTYQLQSMFDLSGTKVISRNLLRMAVFSGARQANITGDHCQKGNSADNHLFDQLMPDELLGKKYALIPFSGQTLSVFSFLVLNNQTEISINGSRKIYDKGVYKQDLTEPVWLESNKNIAVAQFSTSCNCNQPSAGDPNMMTIRPVDFESNAEHFYAPLPNDVANFSNHFITVVCRTNAINTIQLDGINLQNKFNRLAYNDSFSFASLEVSEGFHSLQSDSGFIGYSFGFKNYDAYSNSLGYTKNGGAKVGPGYLSEPVFTLEINPNPIVQNLLCLSFGLPDSNAYTYELSIFDDRGRLILELKDLQVSGVSSIQKIPLPVLAPAMYVARVKIGSKRLNKRFLIL